MGRSDMQNKRRGHAWERIVSKAEIHRRFERIVAKVQTQHWKDRMRGRRIVNGRVLAREASV